MVNSSLMRADPEMRSLLRQIKSRYITKGKRVPSDATLTRAIAKKIKSDQLLYNEIIRL